MKLKKVLVVILAVCLACSTFTSCKKSNETASEDNTIIWYMSKTCENVSSRETVMKEVNKILNERLGLTLDLRMIDMGNYQQKMNVILSSREEFDICLVTNGSQFIKNANDGAFVELTDDMLNKYAPDIVERVPEHMWKLPTINGRIYGIGGEFPLANHPSMVFRKDLVEKYNFDYKSVTCLADLEPYLQIIKENEPNVYPLLRQTPERTSERYIDRSFPGLVFDKEKGEYICELYADDIVEEFRLRNDYYKKGYMPKDANTRTEYLTEGKSGNYAVMGNTGYYSADGSKAAAAYGFPCVEVSMGISPIVTKSGCMNCISTTSKKPEKALALLNEIWKDDYLLNTLAYGIEGVDYTVDEKRSEEIGSKSVIVNSGAMQTWGIWHNWLGPLWSQWDSGWNKVEALREMEELNNTAEVSPQFGFKFDPKNIKNEYARVSGVEETYNIIFSAGCMEDFEQYLADARKQLKEAGVDKVAEEVNRQFRQWEKDNA